MYWQVSLSVGLIFLPVTVVAPEGCMPQNSVFVRRFIAGVLLLYSPFYKPSTLLGTFVVSIKHYETPNVFHFAILRNMVRSKKVGCIS
jgi:hypothetical protein